jgi:hypothetical protein
MATVWAEGGAIHVIIRRMAQFIRQHDWSAVVVEVLVVIVGLMLAFQLDRWWEQRGERAQEAEYVERLISDIETDIPWLDYSIQLAELRLEMADLLMTVSRDPDAAATSPVMFLAAVRQAAFTYTQHPTSHTFEDLRSTGNMRLLRDADIKAGLYDYYDFEEMQSQFRPIQHFIETRHFELAAGILSHEQDVFIQDEFFIISPGELDEYEGPIPNLDEVRAAARRLASNPGFIAWLPESRHIQVEQITMHEYRREKAQTALQALRSLADELSGMQQ